MSDADRIRACNNLKKIQARFESEPSGSKLYSALFCATKWDHPMASEDPPIPVNDRTPLRTELGYGPSEENLIKHSYYGCKYALKRFGDVCDEAAIVCRVLLPKAPVRQAADVPDSDPGFEWGYGDIDSRFSNLTDAEISRWVLILHSLAWESVGGSPLSAQRQIWRPGQVGWEGDILPYDQDRGEANLLDWSSESPEELRTNPPLTGFYFSFLPHHLFRCSVAAIDLILERESAQQEILIPSARLTKTQRSILVAMNNLKCISEGSIKTADEIVSGSTIGNGHGDNIKQQMSKLKKLMYVYSILGSNGGYWLTEAGRRRAEELASQPS